MKYRIKIECRVGKMKYYIVEYKNGWWGRWHYVSHSLQFDLKEIMAIKDLLENGQPAIGFMKPSYRCEQLNLPIE